MGSDAVILQTKQVPGRRGLLPWTRTREEFEITAGLGIKVRTPAAVQNNRRPASSPLQHRASNLQPAGARNESVSYAEPPSRELPSEHRSAPIQRTPAPERQS